jgi:uncharacterized protein (TIGR00725 family)
MGPFVAVVGTGDGASAQECALAEEIGAGVAAGGAVLVTGGRGGVMEAACRGARSELGMTVGLLPGTDREEANGWVSLAIPTGLGEMRNALVARTADVVIAVAGRWGTLSEVAFARMAQTPVIVVESPLADGAPDIAGLPGVELAATPADAVARALALAGSAR